MIRYTKEYIQSLLDKYMDGTTTLEEEDALARFFRHQEVPAEWEDYRLLFREIDAMKPVSSEIVEIKPENRRKQWMGWSAAAAVAAVILYFAIPPKQTEPIEPLKPLTAKVDTATTVSPQEIRTSEAKTDTVSPQETPVQTPKRSRRKPRPTMLDHDKSAVLLAQAQQECQAMEMQLAEAQQEILQAQLTAAGFIAIQKEDGTIVYINDPKEYFAYEE